MPSRAPTIATLVMILSVVHGAAHADGVAPRPSLEVGTMEAEVASKFAGRDAPAGLEVEATGGRVGGTQVEATSAWHALGLRAGDVVLAINGADVARRLDVNLHVGVYQRVIYVEVERGKKPLLLRRVIVGDIAPPPALSPDPAVEAELAKLVTHLGGTRWEVDVDALLADHMRFTRGARVVPSVKDGKPNGMKLYAIRPSSLYAHLGLRNGDTIVRVGAIELRDMEAALDAYTQARGQDRIEVAIIRRGKPLTHTYVRKPPAKPATRKP